MWVKRLLPGFLHRSAIGKLDAAYFSVAVAAAEKMAPGFGDRLVGLSTQDKLSALCDAQLSLDTEYRQTNVRNI